MRFLISKLYISVCIFGILFSHSNLVFATSAVDLYFLAQKAFYQLKASPEKQKLRHHWMKTIKMFSKVVDDFPKSNEAYRAEFTTGKLYEGLGAISKNPKDLEKAAYHYNKVYMNFASGNLSDDALFRIAEIYLVNRKLSPASEILKKIINKYAKKIKYGKGICPVADDMLDNRYMSILLCSYDFKKRDADNIIKAFHKVWNSLKLIK